MGIELFQLGQVEMAAECWQDGAREDCLSTALWNNIAVTEFKKERWDEALGYLEKAYRLSNYHPRVIANLGWAHLRRNDLYAAEVWAQQAIALNPNLGVPYLILSEVALQKGEQSKGLQHALRAAILHPQSPEIQAQIKACRMESAGPSEALPSRSSPLTQLSYHLIDEFLEPPWGQVQEGADWPEPEDDDGAGSGVPRIPFKPRPSGTAFLPEPESDQESS